MIAWRTVGRGAGVGSGCAPRPRDGRGRTRTERSARGDTLRKKRESDRSRGMEDREGSVDRSRGSVRTIGGEVRRIVAVQKAGAGDEFLDLPAGGGGRCRGRGVSLRRAGAVRTVARRLHRLTADG